MSCCECMGWSGLITAGLAGVGAGLGAATAAVLGGPAVAVGAAIGAVHLVTAGGSGFFTLMAVNKKLSSRALENVILLVVSIAVSTLASWAAFAVAGAASAFVASLIFSSIVWGAILATGFIALLIFVALGNKPSPEAQVG